MTTKVTIELTDAQVAVYAQHRTNSYLTKTERDSTYWWNDATCAKVLDELFPPPPAVGDMVKITWSGEEHRVLGLAGEWIWLDDREGSAPFSAKLSAVERVAVEQTP